MSNVELSDFFFLVLKDGDKVWPSTMAGSFRIIHGGEGHNVLGRGEYDAAESEMIDGVLNQGKISRSDPGPMSLESRTPIIFRLTARTWRRCTLTSVACM
jgi:hypothetical protein